SALRPAAEALQGAVAERVLARAVRPRHALATPRTPAYLRWRYGAGPIPYHALLDGDALVILRVRERGPLAEAVVDEVLAPDAAAARRGLSRAVRASGAHHAVAHFGQEWPARVALARAGFAPLPGQGMIFVVRPVGAAGGRGSGPDPLRAASWSLSLGDLEVF
ncbi:MAG TPA: GNAT family N-acetyltransferase, partial [Actinomycetota bacterium]|nr:GNAT family N-acetyltransferase [Actinomycetota bacterium]